MKITKVLFIATLLMTLFFFLRAKKKTPSDEMAVMLKQRQAKISILEWNRKRSWIFLHSRPRRNSQGN
jgi:hypothetical protein